MVFFNERKARIIYVSRGACSVRQNKVKAPRVKKLSAKFFTLDTNIVYHSNRSMEDRESFSTFPRSTPYLSLCEIYRNNTYPGSVTNRTSAPAQRPINSESLDPPFLSSIIPETFPGNASSSSESINSNEPNCKENSLPEHGQPRSTLELLTLHPDLRAPALQAGSGQLGDDPADAIHPAVDVATGQL